MPKIREVIIFLSQVSSLIGTYFKIVDKENSVSMYTLF